MLSPEIRYGLFSTELAGSACRLTSGFDVKALRFFSRARGRQGLKVAPGTQLSPCAADTANAVAAALRYKSIQACSESSRNNRMSRQCLLILSPWKRRS